MNATIFLEFDGTRPLGPDYGCKNVVAGSVDLLLNLPGLAFHTDVED